MKTNINEERKKRYWEKIAHAHERLLDLEEWLPQKNKVSTLASEKAFQEAAEAITDIFAMHLVDLKLPLGDDYTNIETIARRKIITQDHAKICGEANGLRNRVTHRYNRVDDEKFRESASHLIPNLDEVLDTLDKYIQQLR